jgi:two-component system, chemotaxis family, protein-glutamate methylesterase/glutaminase
MDAVRPGDRAQVVVIGASAGGIEALKRLVQALPADFSIPLLVVVHVAPTQSVLPEILSRAGRLPAEHARDGAELTGGRIYVAPPDCHLLVAGGTVRVVRGPKENGHRPAIDPTFRTAAAEYGRGVVGVVLSGALHDGTAGLAAVKEAGGLTAVQDPEEASYPAMPASAIAAVQPDYVLTIEGLGALLVKIAAATSHEPEPSLFGQEQAS